MAKKQPNCEDVQRLIADEQESSEEYASYGESEMAADEARHKLHWLNKEPLVCSKQQIANRQLLEARAKFNKELEQFMEPSSMNELEDK